MDIQSLRKSRSTDFSKITSEFEKISNPGAKEDTRFWKLDPDKAGNATATIRFLPSTEGEELPFVRVFNHAFKNEINGKWYIESSLTTIGKDDPVGIINGALWATGLESNKEIARKQKRNLKFISNVYIVNDPKHPENNGKVMLYRYGKKIFDKIMDKAKPTFEDEKAVNVFDLWDGADFKLRQKQVEKYPNYDDSVFLEPNELLKGDEEKILEVVNAQYKLTEFLDEKNFKSYEELEKRLNLVLGVGTPAKRAEEFQSAPEIQNAKAAPEPAQTKVEAKDSTEDEDVMSYFNSLSEDY